MVQYRTLDAASIALIFDQYTIGEILDYKALSGGSENTNYRITSTEGEYVLTICERKSEMETLNLAYLLAHLNKHEFATSQILPTKQGALVGRFEDKPILLKTFIKGIITPNLSNAQMEVVGQQLATLHTIPTPDFIPQHLGYGIEQFVKIQKHRPNTLFCKWLTEIQSYIASFLQEDLPKALLHSDVFFNNIIIDSITGQSTIIDFEEAAHYYRIYDIGMTLIGTCMFDSQLQVEQARCLLKGYQQKSPLSKQEQDALQAFMVYAATATAFWRYMNFNIVRPDETNKDRYKEMQRTAIYVQEIPSHDFNMLFL